MGSGCGLHSPQKRASDTTTAFGVLPSPTKMVMMAGILFMCALHMGATTKDADPSGRLVTLETHHGRASYSSTLSWSACHRSKGISRFRVGARRTR
jgi:hypothetical protein